LHPLSFLPDGFSVKRIADTGVFLIDGFCTHEEARTLMKMSEGHLSRSAVPEENSKKVAHSDRTSSDAVFSNLRSDPVAVSLAIRAAMLLGVPHTCLESFVITRYGEGEYHKGHVDYSDEYLSNRLFSVLLCLSDLDEGEGGETWFRDLNLLLKPKCGRAACWIITNPDGSRHFETWHAALPPKGKDTEKWMMQMWFRAYPTQNTQAIIPDPPQYKTGHRLNGDEPLPPGAFAPGDVDEESLYAPAASGATV